MPTDTQPAPIPTDVDELAQLLRISPAYAWNDIYERLAGQLDQIRAGEIYDVAHDLVIHEQHIDSLRDQLQSAMTYAGDYLHQASHTLTELASAGVYDVEYAEGGAYDDLDHHLAAAARSLRAAQALNPVKD